MRPWKLLLVARLSRHSRSTRTVTKYVEVGRALGHEVAVFGEPDPAFPAVPHSLAADKFDFAVFVVDGAGDFPELPELVRLLDAIPKERRAVIDCHGRYNETIEVDGDCNHTESVDTLQGWEWMGGLKAVSSTILQPTLTPLREDVRPFLFHAYDPAAVARPVRSPAAAAGAWRGEDGEGKRHGVAYVGNSRQLWTEMARFLLGVEPVGERLGPIFLAGSGWAGEQGGDDADAGRALLERLGVVTQPPVRFDEVVDFVGRARFCPIIHRPLFLRLGLVTNRMFETFCANTIPLLLLPAGQADAVYGTAARPLLAGDNPAEQIEDVLDRPEFYWDAVLRTREHLAAHHSYEQRFRELLAILEQPGTVAASRRARP